MTDKKRKVEVFTAGCPVCDSTVKLVQELACPSCDIRIHDLNKGCETDECRIEATKYGVRTIPAVVIDGKILSCCSHQGPNRDTLKEAGVGTAL